MRKKLWHAPSDSIYKGNYLCTHRVSWSLYGFVVRSRTFPELDPLSLNMAYGSNREKSTYRTIPFFVRANTIVAEKGSFLSSAQMHYFLCSEHLMTGSLFNNLISISFLQDLEKELILKISHIYTSVFLFTTFR